MAIPDTGQRSAHALYVATAGSGGADFELEADVAINLAAACDRLVQDLRRVGRTEPVITQVTGFSELPSGRALAQGFSAKGRELLDTLTAFQQTALLLEAAYLAAGAQFEAADAAGRAALEVATGALDDPAGHSGERDG